MLVGSATTVATAARKFCYVPEISSYAASAVIEFCIRSVRNKSYNLKQDDRGLKFLSWFVRSAQACEHLARGSCESGGGADDITFVMTKSPDFAAFLQGMSFRSSSPVHLKPFKQVRQRMKQDSAQMHGYISLKRFLYIKLSTFVYLIKKQISDHQISPPSSFHLFAQPRH